MPEQTDPNTDFRSIQKFNNTKAPSYVSLYANNAIVASSYFDLMIAFGEVLGLEGDTLNVEQKVKVTMAMPHAKLLALLLMHQINLYESNFGEIFLPPNAIPPEVVKYLVDFKHKEVEATK
jgi:hypothetical protein